jgi:hypothetical protein
VLDLSVFQTLASARLPPAWPGGAPQEHRVEPRSPYLSKDPPRSPRPSQSPWERCTASAVSCSCLDLPLPASLLAGKMLVPTVSGCSRSSHCLRQVEHGAPWIVFLSMRTPGVRLPAPPASRILGPSADLVGGRGREEWGHIVPEHPPRGLTGAGPQDKQCGCQPLCLFGHCPERTGTRRQSPHAQALSAAKGCKKPMKFTGSGHCERTC